MILPNFLIVGAMRSGTTSLTQFLRNHPDVFMADRKELHFFDFAFEKGVPWYASHFEDAGERQVIGEATPNYMYFSEAIVRIGGVLPAVKLVAILRDPVDRAYSHYWHNRSTGREELEFSEALAREADRLTADDAKTRALWSYVDRGHYVAQLERVLQQVDRSRLLVLLFDDLRSNPFEVYRSLCNFLAIDEVPVDLQTVSNRFVAPRSKLLRSVTARAPAGLKPVLKRLNTRSDESYPPMGLTVSRTLKDRFEQDNAALSTWLGRDLKAWSR